MEMGREEAWQVLHPAATSLILFCHANIARGRIHWAVWRYNESQLPWYPGVSFSGDSGSLCPLKLATNLGFLATPQGHWVRTCILWRSQVISRQLPSLRSQTDSEDLTWVVDHHNKQGQEKRVQGAGGWGSVNPVYSISFAQGWQWGHLIGTHGFLLRISKFRIIQPNILDSVQHVTHASHSLSYSVAWMCSCSLTCMLLRRDWQRCAFCLGSGTPSVIPFTSSTMTRQDSVIHCSFVFNLIMTDCTTIICNL